MGHSYILLVQADSLEEAKSRAEDFCYSQCGSRTIFKQGRIVPDNKTKWNRPLAEVRDKLPPDTHVEDAQCYLAKGNREIENKRWDEAGYYFSKAGELLEQIFCFDCKVFNIRYHNYNRDCSEGWYAVEVSMRHC